MLNGITMHSLKKGAGVVAVLLLLLIGATTPAHAHAQLIEVTPETGSSLATSPPEARLVFSENLMDFGYAVVVSQLLDGEEPAPPHPEDEWVSGEPELDGPAISIPLKPDLPQGQYRVAWRVVSADGHPISGVVDFAVGQEFNTDDVANAGTSGAEDSGAGDFGTGDAGSTQADAGTDGASSLWRPLGIGVGGAAIALAVWLGIAAARRGAIKRNESKTS